MIIIYSDRVPVESVNKMHYFYWMGLYEYMMLDEAEQWNELWENGQHLTSIKYIDSKYSLYALHKFFVEVELSPATDKIIRKAHFKTGKLLDKYSGKIDL